MKIWPQDIDSVCLDQTAVLRFAAFNTRTTPEIDGTLSRVSADVTSDPKTGQSYCTAWIKVADAQRDRLGSVRLVPGLPVEAYLQFHERSVMSHLVKPLTDQMTNALREN